MPHGITNNEFAPILVLDSEMVMWKKKILAEVVTLGKKIHKFIELVPIYIIVLS